MHIYIYIPSVLHRLSVEYPPLSTNVKNSLFVPRYLLASNWGTLHTTKFAINIII